MGHWFKFIWTWLKGNWLVVIIGIALVYVMILARNKQSLYDHLLKEFQGQMAQNHADLDALRQVQQDQIQKQQQITQKYQEVMDKIARDYAASLQTLDAQKQRQLHDIVAQNSDNPDVMAAQINTLLGIPLYTVGSQSTLPVPGPHTRIE